MWHTPKLLANIIISPKYQDFSASKTANNAEHTEMTLSC